MRAAGRGADQYTDEHRHGPAERNDDPSAIVAFGAFEDHVRHDAVTQEDEERGADNFAKECRHNRWWVWVGEFGALPEQVTFGQRRVIPYLRLLPRSIAAEFRRE